MRHISIEKYKYKYCGALMEKLPTSNEHPFT
jgi:hypothetical protein